MLISTKLIIRRRELVIRKTSPTVYLYIACIYFYARTRTHIRPRIRPAVYIYIPTYWGLRFGGTPSTRLDLRLFNSSACQKHQCTLCSLIVLFPFLSFSVFRPLPFDPFPLAFSRAEPTLFPSFSPFREYTALLPPPFFSRYNCLLSLVLSNPSLFPDFPSPFGTLLPFVRGRRLPSGWRTIRSNTLR